ncbi:MAG: glycosyltransferase family A protein [Thermoleophilaceae bacterium]
MAVVAIVPVHGRSPYLEGALDALFGQDPAPDEVVVVDDGSPEPVSVPEGRCRLVRRDERGGPAAARESGLAAAPDADLVAFADADDRWLPGKLAAQLDALGAHPDAALCFGRALVVGPDGRPTGEEWETLRGGVHSAEELGPLLYERNPIPASSVIVRRDALLDAGGFAGPADLGSDWDLWLRLVRRGASFVCEPRARIEYRRHPGGVTADVARLAEASLAIHAEHASLVSPEVVRRVRARDLTALARGRVRRRDYAGAREALADAGPPGPRERLLAALLRVPGARGLLGRRDPHR